MIDRIRRRIAAHPHILTIYLVGIAVTALLFLLARSAGDYYGWGYVAAAVMLVFAFRPHSALHRPTRRCKVFS